ncbi:hypothetical protein [Burkholderia pseudomallei]|uniref:hypothetical protein n=1 Tax=Burkholderia pseudomallei TaxID=28450 RepID=UPI0011C4B1E8|nr:hypothetical protein [Burkholderia pseudomallei]
MILTNSDEWVIGVIKRPKFVAAFVVIVLVTSVALFLYQHGGRKVHQQTADDRRDQDVAELSWRIQLYAQKKGKLPGSLSELVTDGVDIPVDPVTSTPYSYEVLGQDSFRVCAVFSSASQGYGINGAYHGDPIFGSWVHGIGRQCLGRTTK